MAAIVCVSVARECVRDCLLFRFALILFLHCHLGHCIAWIRNSNVSLCFKTNSQPKEKKATHSICFSGFVVANQTLIAFQTLFFIFRLCTFAFIISWITMPSIVIYWAKWQRRRRRWSKETVNCAIYSFYRNIINSFAWSQRCIWLYFSVALSRSTFWFCQNGNLNRIWYHAAVATAAEINKKKTDTRAQANAMENIVIRFIQSSIFMPLQNRDHTLPHIWGPTSSTERMEQMNDRKKNNHAKKKLPTKFTFKITFFFSLIRYGKKTWRNKSFQCSVFLSFFFHSFVRSVLTIQSGFMCVSLAAYWLFVWIENYIFEAIPMWA